MKIWENKEAIEVAVKNSTTLTEVIKRLGMNPKGSTTRKLLNVCIERFNVDISHIKHIKTKIRWNNKELLQQTARQSISMTEFLENLELAPRSGNFYTAKKYLDKHEIDISHFDPITAGQKNKTGTKYNPIPIQEILEGKHPTFRTYHLKQRLIREGIKENKCEECGISEWREQPLSLELDHIDGNRNNHKQENLRLLCPNCHSQTPTFKGRNK